MAYAVGMEIVQRGGEFEAERLLPVRQARVLRPEQVYRDVPFEGERMRAVRQELAVLPIVLMPVVPVEQEKQAVPPPETLGDAIFEWILGGIGLLLLATGKGLESLKQEEGKS
jgi:hypothetical protein